MVEMKVVMIEGPAGLSFDESRPGAYSGAGVAPGD